MNNKKNLVIYIISILLISLLTFPNAKADFIITNTQNEAVVCPGSTALFTSVIDGTGDFTVNLEGSASSFSTVVPLGFSLIAEQKTLFIYSTPNSRVLPGKYDLTLVVNDGSIIKKTSFIINVGDCHKITVTGSESKQVCGCNSERYSFLIKNDGNFQETYDLSLGGSSSSWSKLSETVTTLNPGEVKQVFADINVPCNTKGVFDIILIAKSRSSLASSSAKSSIDVRKCYDYTASIGKNFISFCEKTDQKIPIKIKNDATEKNSYKLSISGPEWANLDRKNIFLEGLAEETLNLVLAPDYGIKGDFDINVKIEDNNGKLKTESNVKASVKQCNNVEVLIPIESDRICQGLDKVYEISVKNTGEFPKLFNLLKNQEFIRTDKDSLNLNPGEEKKLALEVDASQNVPSGLYELTITAQASDTDKIKNSDSFNLDIISGKECYKPEIKAQDIKLKQDSSISQAIEIFNSGKFETTYNLGISGTASNFIQLNPATLTIKPGKSEVVYLYASPSITTKPGIYKATIFIRSKDTDTILGTKNIDIDVLSSSEVLTEPVTETTITNKTEEKKEGLFTRLNKWFENLLAENQTNKTLTGQVTQNITKEEIKDISELKQINENTKFKYNNEEHELLITSVKNDSVVIVIKSNVTAFSLKINQEKEVDVNGDGKKDIVVKLLKIENSKPVVEVKEINQIQELQQQKSSTNLKYIYAGAALIIIIILILVFRRQISGFFEEDKETEKRIPRKRKQEEEFIDEEVKELKIGRYVIALILIIIIVYLFRRFNFIEKLNPYRFFVLGALVLLLIIVILVKYWEEISDFFEEEEETPKKDNNRRKKK